MNVQDPAENFEIWRFIRVKKEVGLSRSTLWRRVKGGSFPPPVALGGNLIGWRSCDIEGWKAALPVAGGRVEQ